MFLKLYDKDGMSRCCIFFVGSRYHIVDVINIVRYLRLTVKNSSRLNKMDR